MHRTIALLSLTLATCGPSTAPDTVPSMESSDSFSDAGSTTGCELGDIAAGGIGGPCGFGGPDEVCGGVGVCRENDLGEICVAFCGADWDQPCDPLCGSPRVCQGNKCIVPCPCPAGMICVAWPVWSDPEAKSCVWPR